MGDATLTSPSRTTQLGEGRTPPAAHHQGYVTERASSLRPPNSSVQILCLSSVRLAGTRLVRPLTAPPGSAATLPRWDITSDPLLRPSGQPRHCLVGRCPFYWFAPQSALAWDLSGGPVKKYFHLRQWIFFSVNLALVASSMGIGFF